MKKLVTALLVLLCLVTLSATVGAQAQGTTKKVNFSYMTFIGRETDMVGVTLDTYMKKYPNISVDYQIVDHDTLQQKLEIMAQSNSMPDMFWDNGTHLVDFLNRTTSVVDCTPFYDPAFKATFVEGALTNLTSAGGKIAGFPTEMQVQGWVYNKALFDKYGLKIPTTFDQLKNCVATFKKNGVVTIAYGSKEGWAVWGYQAWLMQYGIWEQAKAVFKDHTLKAVDADFGQAYYREAELRALGAFPEDNATMSFDQMCAMFNAGNAAMITLPSDQLGKIIGQPLEKNYVFNFGFAFTDPVAKKYNQKRIVRSVGNAFGIGATAASDPDKLKAIVAFNKWRYSSEGAQLALKVGTIMPVNVKIDMSGLGPIMKQQVAMIQDKSYTGLMNSDYAPYWQWSSNGDLWTQGWGTIRGNLENSLMNGSMTAADIPGELAKMDAAIDEVIPKLPK